MDAFPGTIELQAVIATSNMVSNLFASVQRREAMRAIVRNGSNLPLIATEKKDWQVRNASRKRRSSDHLVRPPSRVPAVSQNAHISLPRPRNCTPMLIGLRCLNDNGSESREVTRRNSITHIMTTLAPLVKPFIRSRARPTSMEIPPGFKSLAI
jgi:hypothetical protein